jgi:hypothetical protein
VQHLTAHALIVAMAPIDDSLVVRFVRRILHERPRPVGVGQSRHLRSGRDQVVAEQGHGSLVAFEVDEFDRDGDLLAVEGRIESVPEVLGAQLAGCVGKRGVEHEPQGVQEVGLAGSVLTDDHDGRGQVEQVEVTEVAEAADRDSADIHGETLELGRTARHVCQSRAQRAGRH